MLLCRSSVTGFRLQLITGASRWRRDALENGDKMKIKIDQPVRNFDGTTIESVKTPAVRNADGRIIVPAEIEMLTFRTVIENAINLQTEAQPLTAEKKLRAFQIGVKLNAKRLAEYELTVDQIVFVKERVGTFYSPVVYGRFLQLIGDETVKLEDNELIEDDVKKEPRKRHKSEEAIVD